MPARTVVLERLDKYNGEGRVQITPGEYTQLTGRAGRRGIDTQGHSVVQWAANLDPATVAGLASKRTYPLISPFRPTYNMSVNLVEAFGRTRAREVLETSFAQFQADRSVVGLARGIKDKQESLEGYDKAMACHLGDFREYAQIRRDISDLERSLASGRRSGGNDIRQTQGRNQKEQELASLKKRMKQHPCHSCQEREAHARWAERWFRLAKETNALVEQIEGRTNQVARSFDRICGLLVDLEYLVEADDDLEVTEHGKRLARIYGERDLLIAEALRNKTWDDLDPAGLAAMAATLIYESRGDDDSQRPKLPRGNFETALENTELIWHDIELLAQKHRLARTSPLDASIALSIHRWASGARFDAVLNGTDMLPGDFIRQTKMIIDLLDQIAVTKSGAVSDTARLAVDRVKRGIVAYSYFA
jgi:ATP-dependent RNA helicase HelY